MGAAASKREVKATVSYPSVSYPSVARASIAPLRESELGKSHAEEPPSRRKSREGSAALVDELVARERRSSQPILDVERRPSTQRVSSTEFARPAHMPPTPTQKAEGESAAETSAEVGAEPQPRDDDGAVRNGAAEGVGSECVEEVGSGTASGSGGPAVGKAGGAPRKSKRKSRLSSWREEAGESREAASSASTEDSLAKASDAPGTSTANVRPDSPSPVAENALEPSTDANEPVSEQAPEPSIEANEPPGAAEKGPEEVIPSSDAPSAELPPRLTVVAPPRFEVAEAPLSVLPASLSSSLSSSSSLESSTPGRSEDGSLPATIEHEEPGLEDDELAECNALPSTEHISRRLSAEL